MKSNRAIIILALSTILIGALLIAFPANAAKWLVMAIGALFLVPGVVGVTTYAIQRHRQAKALAEGKETKDNKDDKNEKKNKNIFPFIGLGSILFGAVLLIIPSSFQNALLYILGAFLVLAGLTQIYRFLQLRKQYQLSTVPYIVSALVSIAGIVIIVLNYNGGTVTTAKTATNPYYLPSRIFGVASVVFGLSEIIYAIQFRKSDKTPAPQPAAEEPKPVEPVAEEPKPTVEAPKPVEPVIEEPKPAIEAPKPAEPEPTPAPSFQVPEYTTTNDASYATSAQPRTTNPTIEAEVDSET